MARRYGLGLFVSGPSGYKCKNCGYEFFQPINRGNGGYPEEEYYECPSCGSTDYEECYFNDYPDEDDDE